jgi:death-on-curing protein
MKHLTLESVIRMHGVLIQQTGGLDGVRDMGMLDMSLNSPNQTVGKPRNPHPVNTLNFLE